MESVTRRGLLIGAGALAMASVAEKSVAAGPHAHDSAHGHHHGARHQALIDAALDCVGKGEVCADHCLGLFKDGDTSLADCFATVQAMLPMCVTLAKLAAFDSRHLPRYAELCIAFCDDCEKECRKHEDDHAQCQACAESCARCSEECRKVIG